MVGGSSVIRPPGPPGLPEIPPAAQKSPQDSLHGSEELCGPASGRPAAGRANQDNFPSTQVSLEDAVMIKKVIIIGVGLFLLCVVLFGTSALSYVRTSAG